MEHAKATILLASLLLAGPGPTQDPGGPDRSRDRDQRIARAIERLDSEAAAVRAEARKTILDIAEPAIDALRRHLCVGEDVFPEQLFAIAESLGRQRRDLRFETLQENFGGGSWRIEWLPGGRELAILREFGGRIEIFDADLQPTGRSFGGKVAYFAFCPADSKVAFDGADGNVVIQRGATEQVRIAGAERSLLAFSPDGRHVATGGYGHVVELWNAADGELVRRFTVAGTKGGLSPLFSPDAKRLVVGNRNDRTFVFDVASGEVVHVLERRMTHQPAFSPDGRTLAIGYVDGKIGIWDMASGELVTLLDGVCREVFSVAWSPDGGLFASAGRDGPIVVWNTEHHAKLLTLESGSERTFRVAFRPDGKMLVAAGDGATRAWSITRR